MKERVDQYLKEAFENRLASMMSLRAQMEDLTNAQKQEETQYVNTIKEILKRSTFENEKRKDVENQLKERLSEMESKLREEYNSRQKTFDEFQSFKEKGTSIIYRLRDSLKKITEKYKYEKQKTSAIKKQLRECEEAWEEESKKYEQLENALRENQDSEGKHWQDMYVQVKKQNSELIDELALLKSQVGNVSSEKSTDSRLKEYKGLVESQSSIIKELQKSLSSLKQENIDLTKQNEALKEKVQHEPSDFELLDAYSKEMTGLLDPEDTKRLQTESSPQEKIQAQNRIIKLLLSKLKNTERENRHTLSLEQERAFNFLVKKMKELEDIIELQKREAECERDRINALLKGEIDGDNFDEKTFRDLEMKLDVITKDLNNSIQSNQGDSVNKEQVDLDMEHNKVEMMLDNSELSSDVQL